MTAKTTKLDLWWRLCLSEIERVDVWERVCLDEKKPLPSDLAHRRELYRGLQKFLERIEQNREAHERIMGRVK